MWYAVLNKESMGFKAGSVFSCLSVSKEEVEVNHIGSSKNMIVGWTMSKQVAKVAFTRPTRDLDSAMEESFMVCEREYC